MTDLHSTDRPTSVQEYYSYRLSVDHSQWGEFRAIIDNYSKDWVVCLHYPDEEEGECKKEHFHAAFRDFDKKKIDAFRKAVAKHFGKGGNALHAGCVRDNNIVKAIGYMKHDERGTFYHSPQVYWKPLINDAEPFVKGAGGGKMKKAKERLSDPILTYTNVVKQAIKFRNEHAMYDTDSLQNVLSRMVNQGAWIPSRELLRNGCPKELHEMFSDRVNNRVRDYNWMKPHVPSEDKQRWLDRPDDTPIIVGNPVGNPGDSI